MTAEELLDFAHGLGKKEVTEKVIRNMLADGLPFDQIVKCTGLTDGEVPGIIDRIDPNSLPRLS